LPLRPGHAGEAVADLQRRLRACGQATDGDPLGTFGSATEAAVRRFQEHRGLRVDGICGPDTWTSLVEAGHGLGDRLLYQQAPMLRGDDVADLQRLLGNLGFDAGRVDGFFGPDTTRAVVEFQRNAGLPTDGVCGPDTVRALRRVAGRTSEGTTVAGLREADALRHEPRGVGGRRVVIAEGGEAAGLADSVGRALQAAGAVVAVVHHPDDHEKATAANTFEASVFLALVVRDDPGVTTAYYAHENFESVGGRRLAELVLDELPDGLAQPAATGARGMRLPVLRETRMPAVLVEIGPPTLVVEQTPRLVGALAAAVGRWSTEPPE